MKKRYIKILRVISCFILIGLIVVAIYFKIPYRNADSEKQLNKEVGATKTKLNKYDYSKPVPLSEKVNEDYFKDAIFFGDSLTYGMTSYFPINKDNIIACKGATIQHMMECVILSGKEEYGDTNAFKEVKKRNPKKIYVMMGTNGFAWMTKQEIISDYEKLIDKLMSDNPNAKMYIQSMFPVSKNKETSDGRYNNHKITDINSSLLTLTQNKKIYYLDTNSVLNNKNGYLSEEYTNLSDGIHVNADAYKLWFDYLCEHTV